MANVGCGVGCNVVGMVLVFITTFVRFGPMSDIVCKQNRSASMPAWYKVQAKAVYVLSYFILKKKILLYNKLS